jgi:SAM-dependent methyltransferase
MELFALIDATRPATVMELGYGHNVSLAQRYEDRIDMTLVDDYQELGYWPSRAWWEEQHRAATSALSRTRVVRALLGEDDGLPEQSFDMIVSVSVLEEVTVDTLRRILQRAYRLLKPGGIFASSCDLQIANTAHFDAYVEAHRACGFESDPPPPSSVTMPEVQRLLLEAAPVVMCHYQGADPEERTYWGHFGTVFSVARRPGA